MKIVERNTLIIFGLEGLLNASTNLSQTAAKEHTVCKNAHTQTNCLNVYADSVQLTMLRLEGAQTNSFLSV